VLINDPEKLLNDYLDSETGSGRVLTRTFCCGCGSSIFAYLAALPQMIYVSSGTVDKLEEIEEWKPELEGYCQDARKWFGGVENSTRFDKLFDYGSRFPEIFESAKNGA
jgi:hypothetical protein